ncbi:MAG: UDP-N-acetylglucosamine--N-acetylmuramyl-(pentapeptide) pyrophosphoryl-undecaprenol N-acetylglucosamine transferase [bacterium]
MRVMLSGGGTLGSVAPLLAVAEEIRRRDPGVSLLWIGTKGGPERRLVERLGFDFRPIAAGRLRRFLTWRNFFLPFAVLHGLADSLSVLRSWRPDVVVHAGGFVAVPLTWAAWLLRIPVHVHQLDWRPGLANRLSVPFARSVSVSFAKSKQDFDRHDSVLTGTPVRVEMLAADRSEAYRFFGLDAGRPVLVVLGGGTGAVGLNRLMVSALPDLDPSLQVVHLTGPDKEIDPPDWGGDYRQFDFLDRGYTLALSAADLAVTRAGMGTLTELAVIGLPAVIVPMPGSHQLDNARLFEESGAAVTFGQDGRPEELARLVGSLLSDGDRLERMSDSMRSLNGPQAASRVADLVLSAAQRHGLR